MKIKGFGLYIVALSVLLLTACGQAGENVEQPKDSQQEAGQESENNDTSEEQSEGHSEGHSHEFTEEDKAQSFMHIHGLSYDPQESHHLYMSTHHGLILVNSEGDLYHVGEEKHRHDLMGFTFLNEGTMISSGHPAESSTLKNPLGVVISKDHGETWEPIALHGMVDFHVFEVNKGDSSVMYGVNSHGTHAGFYRSQDGGKEWDKLNTSGLPEDLQAVYVLVSNPKNPQHILAGTGNGIYASQDGGNTWKMKNDKQSFLSAQTVPQDPQKLIAYVLGNDEGLMISEDFGDSWTSLNLKMEQDVVFHIAIHPNQEGVYTVGTQKENIFQTKDGGASWAKIAEAGKPVK
jgi:photosystem II stability/assembly factor-like uncharacterized protein